MDINEQQFVNRVRDICQRAARELKHPQGTAAVMDFAERWDPKERLQKVEVTLIIRPPWRTD